MSGWVSLHRKILDWEWYDDANACRLFIHCLLKANHQDKKWKGIDIQRGQFITSLDKLSKETGLSVSQIRTCLKKLKSTGEIASKSHTQHTVITVLSYDSYQCNDKQNDKSVAYESQTNSKRVTTTNNDNKENNENKINDVFELEVKTRNKEPENKNKDQRIEDAFNKFWITYHKKQGKAQALRAFKAAVKREGIKDLEEFSEMLITDCKERLSAKQFGFDNLNGATYLNNNRWEDEKTSNHESVEGYVKPDWMRGIK